MKTYLLILFAMVAVASTCKSKKGNGPKLTGEWIYITSWHKELHWFFGDEGQFEMTAARVPGLKETGEWTVNVTDNDSILELVMENPDNRPLLMMNGADKGPLTFTIREHKDTSLVLVQMKGGEQTELKLHRPRPKEINPRAE